MFKLVLKYTKQFKWAAIIAPVLVALEVLFEVYIPRTMTVIIDEGINGAGGVNMDIIYQAGWKMVMYSFAAMLLGAASGILAAMASSGFIRNLRLALYEKIQNFSFANMDKFEVPSLVTRMTKDMRELRMAYLAIIRMLIRAPFQLITSTIMVFTLNAQLGKIFLVAIPVLAIGLYLISHFAHPMFRVLMRKFDRMNASLEENFVGIRVVKTFVRENFEKKKFEDSSLSVRKQQRMAESLVILNNPFFSFVTYACMIAVSWFGGNFIIAGNMTMGEFMSYLSYLRSILFGLMMVSFALMQIIFAQASVDRANEVLNEKIDIEDKGTDPELVPEDGSVEFRNVSFKYTADAHKYALENINLTIKSGEMVGIIGSTGSSKTTLVQLLPRLYDVTEGEVLVGGHDVREYRLDNLRKSVSMVLQKNVLFSGTIEENLKWGDQNATHEEVVEAARCAQAHDFITSF
ncbi:MAG: ABC transporter ATP-binding protein, partial [Erysipelotrichaceae bacterium]|nr:ABC transporter ATP-binding protein [Erysipelotrichaceae bacterium]